MKINEMAIFAVAAALCTTAFAGTDDIKASNNQLEIEAISTKVDYTETNDGRLGSRAGKYYTETGNVPGFALSFSMMKDVLLGNDYLQLQYSKNDGNTNYKGSYHGGSFGSLVGQSDATISDYSLRWGKGFAINGAFMITPYGELGHHERQNSYSVTSSTYTHSWYGAGTLVQYSPFSRLVFGANALVGRTFAADIDLSGPRGFSGSLGDSTLYKAGLSTDYAFTKNFHGDVGVDYTSFKYGASATHRVSSTMGAWMPESQTNDTTLKIGVGYAF